MSSKALATALLSYGSDLKIKNVLMEIFFSALPAIYMSRYKLIDSSDELIVDLLYQKVKATLKERGEYGIVVQSLMLETYPDLDLMEMTPAQISLLGEIAVKRLVYQGVTKISEKIYPDAPWSAQTFDPTLSKRDFLEDLFYVDYNYLIPFLNIEDAGKLSFLNKQGYIHNFKSNPEKSTKDRRFWRNPAGNAVQGSDWGEDVDGFSLGLDYPYKGTTYCFEQYVRLDVKEVGDIILCSKELNFLDQSTLSDMLRLISQMFVLLADGDSTYSGIKSQDPYSVQSVDNLEKMGGRSCVCSVEDLETLWTQRIYPKLLNKKYAPEDVLRIQYLLDAVFKSISLGIRCSADVVPTDLEQEGSMFDYKIAVEEIMSITDAQKNKGFPEKTVFYVEPILQKQDPDDKTWTYNTEPHFTTVLAKTEKVYEPFQIETVIKEGKKWNESKLREVIGMAWLPADIDVNQSLLAALFKTKEFDALIKAVFVPAMLYNTIAVVPNIEIGQEIIPIMRKSGVFKGLDEVLNEMFSSLQNYLSGDHPWMTGCDDLTELL